jgi:hypothetical protein
MPCSDLVSRVRAVLVPNSHDQGRPLTSTSSPKLSAIACKSSRNSSRTASPLIVNASTSRWPKVSPDSTERSAGRTFEIALLTFGLASRFVRSNIVMGVLRRRLVRNPFDEGGFLQSHVATPHVALRHRSRPRRLLNQQRTDRTRRAIETFAEPRRSMGSRGLDFVMGGSRRARLPEAGHARVAGATYTVPPNGRVGCASLAFALNYDCCLLRTLVCKLIGAM